VSLISDALKTAQRQRSEAVPTRPEIPVLGGFFPDAGHRREASGRWRGAAAGGVIGMLLLAGVVGAREWRALHAPVAKIGAGSLLRLPPAPVIQQRVPAQTAAPAPRADSAVAAAQQGEQVARVAAPSVGVASGKPEGAVSQTGAPTRPSAFAQRQVMREPPAPAPSAQAQGSVQPAAASPPAPTSNGVRVSVQGGAQDASDRLLEMARDAQRQGNDAAAEDVYRKAVATHQANAEIYNNYAALLADRADTVRAISMYRLAIALDPTYVDAWANLGTLFDASGDHRQATGVFQQVLKLDSTNVAAREGLAEQYQALGDVAVARKLLEQVTRQAPDNARAHYTLAVLLDGQHDAAGAMREYGLFLETARDRYPAVYSDRVRARIAALSGKKP